MFDPAVEIQQNYVLPIVQHRWQTLKDAGLVSLQFHFIGLDFSFLPTAQRRHVPTVDADASATGRRIPGDYRVSTSFSL